MASKRKQRKKEWLDLDLMEQLRYVNQAEYLIEKGYVSDREPWRVARDIYENGR